MPLALDPLIHQETRLRIVALLAGLGEGAKAEFTWLKEALGLTEGNLSSHLQKLEEAGYVRVEKGFRGKRPKTWVALTPEGRAAYEAYRKALLDVPQRRWRRGAHAKRAKRPPATWEPRKPRWGT